MPFRATNRESSNFQIERVDYEESETETNSSSAPAKSQHLGMAVARTSEHGAPEVEVSAGQKMLSAVSGSILTSLIGTLPTILQHAVAHCSQLLRSTLYESVFSPSPSRLPLLYRAPHRSYRPLPSPIRPTLASRLAAGRFSG